MKKPINYINYTNHEYDVINNNDIDSKFSNYLDKRINYET